MFALGEMQPRYDNHVSLDPKKKDAWGIPAARVECSHSQDEVNMVAHMRRTIPEIAAAGGLEVDANLDLGRGNIVFRMLRSRVFADYGAYWPGAAIHEAVVRGWGPSGELGGELVLSVLGRRQRVRDRRRVLRLVGISEPHAHDDGPHRPGLSVHHS